MQTYTFMCLNQTGVASGLDIVDLAAGDHMAHAQRLLQLHTSARAIEVWSEAGLVEVVERPPSAAASGVG